MAERQRTYCTLCEHRAIQRGSSTDGIEKSGKY
jgi:hypothetical protein